MPNWQQVAYQSAVNAGHPDPDMFVRQMMAESGLKVGRTSSAGAQGIAQIMPATARGWGVNPHDPYASLNAAAKAMTKYIGSYGGDQSKALAAYNAGVGAVQKYNGVPPYKETRAYIQKILGGKRTMGTGQPPAAQQRAVQPAQRGPAPNATALSNQINRIQYAYMDAPDASQPHIQQLQDNYAGQMSAYAGQQQAPKLTSNPLGAGKLAPAGAGYFRTPNGLVKNQLAGEKEYQFLQRLGSKGFGLRNDPGNSQTTGGSHTEGSLHYDERAVDWGDAANTRQQLQGFYDWAEPRKESLGLQELIWQAPGHYNHLHAGKKAGQPPAIKPSNTRRRPVKRIRTANAG